MINQAALAIVFLFAVNSVSLAGFVTCPAHIFKSPKESRALTFFSASAGHYNVGSCKVEIHVCSGASDTTSDAIGDILVTDKGRETYMAVYLPEHPTNGVNTKFQISPQTFHYEIDDSVGGKVSGNLESNKLEIVQDPITHKVQNIDVGTYSTNKDLRHISNYVYVWNQCRN